MHAAQRIQGPAAGEVTPDQRTTTNNHPRTPMLIFLCLFAAIVAIVAIVRPMADATAAVIRKTRARSGHNSYKIANGVTIYPGMLAQLEGGYLNHWDGTGKLIGLVLGDAMGISPAAALTGNTSATPVPQARVDETGVTIMHTAVAGTPTAALVGSWVYCPDSDLANLTITPDGPPVGRLVAYRATTDCDVELFTPTEFGAGVEIGVISQAVTYSQFTDGGSTIGTLTMTDYVPAGAILLGSKVLVTAGFTGDTSAALTISDGSDVDRFNTGTPSVFTAAATGIETGVPSGNKLITTAVQPILRVTSGADFTNVSAGSMTVHIYYLRTASA